MTGPLVLGAVAYDPKVVTIWSGFRSWLREHDFDLDFVLYAHYERQVTDLLAGRIDLAWNSPLAWIRAHLLATAAGVTVRSVAMRDTDQDLTSVIVVRVDSPARELSDLEGRAVAVGAIDSPQATLIPLSCLRGAGLDPSHDIQVRRFDIGVGLHGDHIGGERQAALALAAGQVDAACMIDSNLLLFSQEGTLAPGSVRVLGQTARFDHCNMTSGPHADVGLVDQLTGLLLDMDYGDAAVRPLLDLEGLKQWLPGRSDRYTALEKAVAETGFYDQRGAIGASDYRP